ncbi:MAG: hypothetical protein PUK05_02135 [Peptoniphilaceae bacterium]|nr:hypothetical protein [Peptoniphilaceae bacterium]MDY5765906.1 hypothetical protein [Peptoniphilaceae bacterium]MDY6146205.1 hypothetical protein [Peptoniphilaceae bacterium]
MGEKEAGVFEEKKLTGGSVMANFDIDRNQRAFSVPHFLNGKVRERVSDTTFRIIRNWVKNGGERPEAAIRESEVAFRELEEEGEWEF